MKTMKLKVILLFVLIFHQAMSQDTLVKSNAFLKKNSIQLELLGPSGFYSFGSINYERVLWNGSGWKTNAQAGFSIIIGEEFSGTNFPIAITQLKSFRCHHIEIGIGIVYNVLSHKDDHGSNGHWDRYMHYTARLGYRFQKPDGHFLFRAGYTPIFFPDAYNWGGITFGWSF